jgi:Lon protease-like protein
MADGLEEMPLFPLNTVLFPYAQVHLHVFEPQHRELVRFCMENDVGFGVVLSREGSDTYLVGTAVRIAAVKTLEDGNMDVRIQGQRRFRIRKLDEDTRPFPIGHVEPIVELEVEETPRVTALTFRLKECVEEYIRAELRHYDFRIQRINLPAEPTALSFVVANLLKIENLDKQRLLETTDTEERLAEIVPLMERQIVDVHMSGAYRVTANMLEEWITPN